MYGKLAGMTGTADTEAQEFAKIYNLDVVVIPTNRPVVRDDKDDVIYLTEEEKLEAICDGIAELHAKGQPVLVGTISIEKSEKLSRMLVGTRRPPRGAQRQEPRPRGADHRGRGRQGLGDHRHQHGRAAARTSSSGGNPEFRARKKAGTQAAEEVLPQGAGRGVREVAGRLPGGQRPRRPARAGHGAPRGAAHRQPAPRPLGPAGRPRARPGSTSPWKTT